MKYFFSLQCCKRFSKSLLSLSFVGIIYIVVREEKTLFASDSLNIKYERGGGHRAAQLEQSPDCIYCTSFQKNVWLLSIYIALFVSKPLYRTSLINSPNALAKQLLLYTISFFMKAFDGCFHCLCVNCIYQREFLQRLMSRVKEQLPQKTLMFSLFSELKKRFVINLNSEHINPYHNQRMSE